MDRSLKWWKRESRLMIVMVAVLTLLLLLLAALQYHWLDQLSDAEREHMRGILRAAAGRFSQDFDREVNAAYASFLPDRARAREEDEDRNYAAKYARWASAAQFPHLIQNVWLASVQEKSSIGLRKLDSDSRQFIPCPWPGEMSELRQRLQKEYERMQAALERPAPDRNGPDGGVPRQQVQPVEKDPLALVIPIFGPPAIRQKREIPFRGPPGFIIATLDFEYIRREMLPALARRHFPGENGLNCQITIVSRDAPESLIFRTGMAPAPADASRGQAAVAAAAGADLAVGLFAVRFGGFRPFMPNFPPRATDAFSSDLSRTEGATRPDRPPDDPFAGDSGPGMNGTRSASGGERLWLMLIQHREGSLAAAVAKVRRRNLSLSFGILLLLAGSVVMIVISTRRARLLARQQIEFVAGVTHELRTPVAVICSAGENLADGVIKDDKQISHYGALIRDEGRRLVGMIEQVLDFAAAQTGRNTNDFKAVSVGNLIERAVQATLPAIQAGRFQLEEQIQPDLPQVMGDESALCRALQNLLNNSLKYSGNSRWIGLRAEARSGRTGEDVVITIEDRGIGISPDELPQIFEPFFRGREAAAAQIHGNGLGLAVVRGIIKAHRGRITVAATPGSGSAFSIYLPTVGAESGAETGYWPGKKN